ncbi:MAG: VTT domain-containing protein [Candidatus Undinarchaeales archaeon]
MNPVVKFLKENRGITEFIVAIIAVFIAILIFRYFLSLYPSAVFAVEGFVNTYGLSAGFIVTIVGSLWFLPFPYEFIIGPFMKFHANPFFLLIVFAIASSLADLFNFYSGRKVGEKIIEKKVQKNVLNTIRNAFNKYGMFVLILMGLISPVISYDIVAFAIGGLSTIKYRKLMLVTFIGRFLHLLVVYLFADFFVLLIGL